MRSARGFTVVAVAMAAMAVGANMPTPLFPRYAATYDLTPLDVTGVFAAYTVFLAPALVLFGPLSDAVGRRKIVLVSLGLGAMAAIVLSMSQGLGWLYAGRALQGVAVGALQGTAAAALAETHPRGDVGRAAVTGTFATSAGTAVGPLAAGALAQYLPAPLALTYVVELIVLGLVIGFVLRWLDDPAVARASRPKMVRPSVPAEIRTPFVRAAGSAVLAWVGTALFLALVPSYLELSLGTTNSVVSGAVVAMMLGSSALAQLVSMRWSPLSLQVIGLGLMTGGLALLTIGASYGLILWCLAAALIAGTGHGLAFGGSAREVGLLAPPGRRGGVMSLYFLAIYVGVSIAIIGLGAAATLVGLSLAVQVFAGVVGVGCVVSAGEHVTAARRRGPA